MTEQSSKSNSFVKQAGILAMAGILCRIIGLLYRSPLMHIIGEAGNGYYTPAYRYYQMILLIASYSIPAAISKVVSQRLALHQYKNAQRIFHVAILYVVVVGGAASLFAFFGAGFLLPQRPAMVLRMLAPTIFFSGLLGVMRGYFQANRTMVQTSVSQVLEQIIHVAVSLGAAWLLMYLFSAKDTLTRAAWGAVGSAAGIGVGVLAALLFMLMVYRLNKKTIQKRIESDHSPTLLGNGEILKIILFMVTPVLLSTFAYNASSLINQTLYLNLMQSVHGLAEEEALRINGIYDTEAVGLSNIPIALASAMASAILPSIAASFETQNKEEVNQKIRTAIKTIMFIAIPAAMGMSVLSRPIVRLLYNTGESSVALAGWLLAALGPSIVFYCLSTLSNSILQAVGKVTKPVTNAVISLAVQSLAAALLLIYTDLGIYSLAISVSLYSLLMCVLNGISVRRATEYRQEYVHTFLLPLGAAALMGIAVAAVYYGLMLVLPLNAASNAGCILLSVAVGVIVYFAMSLKLGCMEREELLEMPGGAVLVKVAVKLRLIKA